MAKTGKVQRALEALTAPEVHGIVQRLALFEPPAKIARGYGIPVAVINQVREQAGTDIAALRNSWRSWINRVEPLTNRANYIVFLGNLSRRAAQANDWSEARACAKELRSAYDEAKETQVSDLALLDMIERGEFENARRMATEAEVLDEEGLLPEPSFADYVQTGDADAIAEAAAEIPEFEPEPDPALESINRRRKGEKT